MIVASTGRFWVTWVWRADEPDTYSTTSPTPAPTASTAIAIPPVGLPSTSHARTTSSFRPSSVGSLRLATSVPMILPSTMAHDLHGLAEAGPVMLDHFLVRSGPLPSGVPPPRPSGSTASTLACGRGGTWSGATRTEG